MSETKIDALSIGAKYQTSAVGLVAKGKATYGQWEVALSVACGIAKSCPYWVGKVPHCRWSPKPSDGGGPSKRDAMHGERKHRRCHVSASPMSTCSYPPLITSSAPPRTALGPGAIGYHRY